MNWLVHTLGQGLLHLLYPRICWVCQRLRPLEEPLVCPECAAILTDDPHEACPRCCGTVGPFVDVSEGCPGCRDERLYFDRALRLGRYEGLLRDAILRMKKRRAEGFAEAMGEFWGERMAPRLEPFQADVVVPVPLHWLRHWLRGFNPSEVLARHLAACLGIPCRPDWLRRVRRTEKQPSMQSNTARWENVHDAFALRPEALVAGKTILVVDDVMTSGATASEAARVLRPSKPKLVIAVVLARARTGGKAT